MKKILVLLTVLIVGCQNTRIHEEYAAKKNHETMKQNHSTAIYNRYKNKVHRYTIQEDGAPKIAHTMSFKDPKPAREPLSRYGNPTEYKVLGRTYSVLKSSAGYKTRGVASWYGTKFHNQRTSSGEPYNMYIMSAAHKTLPLPTYVKVKNLDNGREAVVKVNDRGPFHADRIIDLSYAAALKLGVFPKGTARVEIETLAGPTGLSHYYLQAGAFTSEVSAKELKTKLARLTPSPVFIEQYNHHYVVRVGPFAAKNMADSLKTQLAKSGIHGAFSIFG